MNKKGMKGWWHDFSVYAVSVQLRHMRHLGEQSSFIFEFPDARIFMARRFFLHIRRSGAVFDDHFAGRAVYLDIRPIPIAISILLTVSLAIALAFSAPSSRILSNSSVWISSLKRS